MTTYIWNFLAFIAIYNKKYKTHGINPIHLEEGCHGTQKKACYAALKNACFWLNTDLSMMNKMDPVQWMLFFSVELTKYDLQ